MASHDNEYDRLRIEVERVADSLREDREALPAGAPARDGLDVAETRLRALLRTFGESEDALYARHAERFMVPDPDSVTPPGSASIEGTARG